MPRELLWGQWGSGSGGQRDRVPLCSDIGPAVFTQPRECTRHLDTRFTPLCISSPQQQKHMLQSLSSVVGLSRSLRLLSSGFESVIQEWALVVS